MQSLMLYDVEENP
ncbi:hypothetical protein M8J75_007452 [Diaphorina citri]|nr:hypothetical protein M8J75_007452 [Diaphorina citri]